MGLFRKLSRSPKHKKDNVAAIVEEEEADREMEKQLSSVDVPEPQPTVLVVILEFPPSFDAHKQTTAERNPTILFQHETDSVISDVSNCSCRIVHGHRRPDACVSCAEMKEIMMNHANERQKQRERRRARSNIIPTTTTTTTTEETNNNFMPSFDEDPTFSLSNSSRSVDSNSIAQNHRIPPALTMLAKITPRRRKHKKAPGLSETDKAAITATNLSPPSSFREPTGLFRHRRSITADAVDMADILS